MYWDHIIKNGTIVTARETYPGNIYIKDEKIAAISAVELPGEAGEVTDAKGKYVLPGFIDAHVHSRDGYEGAHYKEDFFHSTMAGACGGITTIFEMPNCNPAIYSVENLEKLIECVTPKANVDFGVWGLCLGDLNNHNLMALKEAGVMAFKFFWGYAIDAKTYQLVYNYREGMENVIPPLDQGQVYKIFREVTKTGMRVAIHAENFDIVKLMTAEVMASGDESYEGLLRSRPAVSEITIIQTAIAMAKDLGAKLHILHLAAGDGVEVIRRAQADGVNVTAETCSHYLALTDMDAKRCGAMMKGYPVVRTQYDQDKLWAGLNSGVIGHVCSDHAPHSPEEKQKSLWEAPAGMAGIETMCYIMINAVNEGKITLQKLVEVLSETPARLYGMHPVKGSLEVGSDADIVILDMEREYTFRQEDMSSRTKLSPFDGRKLKGKPTQTILRGRTIVREGALVGKPGGKFVRPL